MKDFLYLDTDYLDSYLSQINNGLIEKMTNSVTDQNETTNETKGSEKMVEIEGSAEGKLGLPPLVKTKGAGKVKGSYKFPVSTTSFAETEIGQSIIAKTVHDDAFNDLLAYISENIDYDLCSPSINHYFSGEIDFNIMDINYYINFFTSNDIKSVMPKDFDVNSDKMNMLNELDNQFESLAREERRARNKEYEKKKKEIENMDGAKPSDYLKAFAALFPYSVFLYTDDLIIPVKDIHLREKPHELLFKYDEKVRILGKITKKIKKSGQNADIFKNMSMMINTLTIDMVKMFNDTSSDELYLVSPIAIYVE